jgi:hypothetical protein
MTDVQSSSLSAFCLHVISFSSHKSFPTSSSHLSLRFLTFRLLPIYLMLYTLVDLGRFFSFLFYTQSVWLLGRGINPSQGRI